MRTFLAAVAAAALLASRAAGQDAQTVTEAEFLAPLALDHPALRALRGDLDAAEAAVLSARALQNPEAGVTHEAPGDSEQLDLTVSWEPPHPGRRRLALSAAEAEVVAARARLASDQTALRQGLRETFARWAVATANSAELAVQAARIDALARRESHRAAAGESSGLDARRLALAAAEARVDLASAEAELRAAEGLARAWRPDLATGVVPELPPLPEASAPPAPEHPRIAALRAELDAARIGERLAGRVFDMPTVVGGWQRQDGGAEVAEGPILGLAWPLPLLDRRRGARVAARARVEALEARLVLAEREVAAGRMSLAARFVGLRLAAFAAHAASEEAGPVVTAATAAFQAGEAELTDLLDALRSATAAKVAAVELHGEALAAHRELSALSAPRAPNDGAVAAPIPSPGLDSNHSSWGGNP